MESRYTEAAGKVALRRDSSEGLLPSSRFRVKAPRPMRRGPAYRSDKPSTRLAKTGGQSWSRLRRGSLGSMSLPTYSCSHSSLTENGLWSTSLDFLATKLQFSEVHASARLRRTAHGF